MYVIRVERFDCFQRLGRNAKIIKKLFFKYFYRRIKAKMLLQSRLKSFYILFALILGLYQSILFTSDYLTYPKVQRIDMKTTVPIDVPAFTLCDSNRGKILALQNNTMSN